MDAARWERVQQLFHDALDRQAGERRAFVSDACADDEELEQEVLSLLEADDDVPPVLEQDLATVARAVLRDGIPPGLLETPFGPYRIEGILGEGGMGVVYLARREDLQSVAAIKILRDAWLSPARRDRFAAEQRTLAQLSHPSIARLYDADTLPDGTPWFVMEYIEGVPLTEYCRQHALAVRDRVKLFRAVCEAVQHAHHHAVIHRDLKPSNIMVTEDGSVKLLDFGIAKHLVDLEVPEDQTRTALRLMTPAYAAPEQIRGEQVGMHTDVYSLGIILYELLTDRLPFDLSRHTPREVETIIAEHEPVRPSAVARRVGSGSPGTSWSDLDVLCLTAMHKDPLRRYRSVEAVIRDIDHYLDGQPLDARPDTLRYRLTKFIRRNRGPVMAAAVVLAAVIALTAFYTVRLKTARDAALAEAARSQRMQAFTLNLFRGGDEAVGPAESLRVISLLDRGVEEARSLDREPLVQAELSYTLGGLYERLGNFARADTLLRASLAQRQRLLGDNDTEVGEGLIALGMLRMDQAQLEEAEQLVRRGNDIITRNEPPMSPRVIRAQASLGRVLQERGAYDESIRILEGVVQARKQEGAPSPELLGAMAELANTHFYAGHYDTSDSINLDVLTLTRTLHGERHPLVAEVYINLGATQSERGNYAAAEQEYRRALDISLPWYGEDHPVSASHLTMLGRALVFEEKLEEGKRELRRALAIRERIFGPDHPQVASTINELGNIAIREDSLAAAEQYYSRMMEIYRKAYNDRHYLIGTAASNLGGVYLARKDYPRAQELYRDAVRRFTDTQGPDHINTGIARIKLGRSLIRDRQYAEGASESLGGYEIVTREATPGVSFLRAARRDLVVAYDSMGNKEAAERFRREIADTSGGFSR
jgi:serine/threonine-protein kinase